MFVRFLPSVESTCLLYTSPVLTATPDESDAVTVTDEESGALTPEGNLTLVDDYPPLPAVISGNGYRRPVEIGEDEPERRW